MPVDPRDPPHLSPTGWGDLIDSLDAATIFVVIRGWLGPEERADISVEDLWQETLWMAWRDRHQHQWQDLARYRAWLLGIARNRLLDAVRARGRSKRGGGTHIARFSELGSHDTVGGMLPPRSTTPSRVASQLERAKLLERALASLPPELAAVVRLRVFEELPMEQVAQHLGVPLSTGKHRLVRGMQAFRARVGEALAGEGPSEES